MKWQLLGSLTARDPQERQKQIIEVLLQNRGLTTASDITAFFNPPRPMELSFSDVGIDDQELSKASSRIMSAIESGEQILIYGDYDADGICATAILWEALFAAGATVKPFIPHREKHGYGLSIKGLRDAIESCNPSLIITVDNGVMAHEAASFLKDSKIDLLISDHHQLGKSLPESLAVVHTDTICGSGVAWFLGRYVLAQLGKETLMERCLDLLCIGTIADLMPLVGVNRSFAKYGLEYLSNTKRVGLQALKEEAGIPVGAISSYHVGFVIGPRINAMGRIDHGLDALRLLCTNNLERARELAHVLGETNKTRQDLTFQSVEQAIALCEAKANFSNNKIIIVDHEEFHEGIIGLIAGKLVEKYHKPAIVLSSANGVAKGSARSVRGVNIIELIRTQSSLLLNAGGHPGAAGLTIATDKLADFAKALTEYSNETIEDSLLQEQIIIDCEVELSDLTLQLYEQIKAFEPFGLQNTKPTFVSTTSLFDITTVGQTKNHLKLKCGTNNGTTQIFEALAFNKGQLYSQFTHKKSFRSAFTLELNTWNNRQNLQLFIKEFLND